MNRLCIIRFINTFRKERASTGIIISSVCVKTSTGRLVKLSLLRCTEYCYCIKKYKRYYMYNYNTLLIDIFMQTKRTKLRKE